MIWTMVWRKWIKWDYDLKKINDMDHDLKEINEMDYGLKEKNNAMTKAEVMWGWVIVSW